MEKWYKNKKLEAFCNESDKVYYEQDIEQMQELISESDREGHNLENSGMIRAKYLYCCFTNLSDWIMLSILHEEEAGDKTRGEITSNYENDYEKCVYLARTSLDLMGKELKKFPWLQKRLKVIFMEYIYR